MTKIWEITIKVCVGAIPFLAGFAIWLTSQIYALNIEAAVAKQQRSTIVASIEKDRQLLSKIHDQQIKVLLTLERLSVQMEKILKKP